MNDSINKDQLVQLGRRVGSTWFKGKVFFILLGVLISSVGWAATGYWDLRKERQALISERYIAFLDEATAFDGTVMAHSAVFSPSPEYLVGERPLRLSAAKLMNYVDSLAVTLPQTQDTADHLVATISELALLLPAEQSAEYGSEEWAVTYGQFRVGLNSYLTARNEFNVAVNTSAGSYLDYFVR
ncbi:hypothetical protein [Ascidiaceihabitans sp.]|uniref:hypothetical protein n=1 Tax=Ascidiaceihabitans sp. TaxID=1872644 RepID=UPI0032990E1D